MGDFNPWFMLGGAALGALEYPQQMKNYKQQVAYNRAVEAWSPWTHRHGQFTAQPSFLNDLLQGVGAGASMSHLSLGGGSGSDASGDSSDPSQVDPGFRGPPKAFMNKDEGLDAAGAEAAATDSTPPDQPAHVGSPSQATPPPVAAATAPSTAAPGGPTHVYSQGAAGGGNVPPNPGYSPGQSPYAQAQGSGLVGPQPPLAGAVNPPGGGLPPVQRSEIFNPYQNAYSPGAVGGYTVPYSPDYLAAHPELQYPGPYVGRTSLRG